jgi:hypothetical protein
MFTRFDRNAKRVGEILAILGRYGLADWLSGLNYEWLQGRFVSFDGERLGKLTQEARIRLALTELGTTFIKLGQMLSTRADLVGPDLAAELPKSSKNRSAPNSGNRPQSCLPSSMRGPWPRPRLARCIKRSFSAANKSSSRFNGPGSRTRSSAISIS